MLRRLLTALSAVLVPCPGCGGWYRPGDPADWAAHKNC